MWPIHPKPLPDELLSSWMVRTARAYRIRPASFWKREAGRIHFRKVDLTAEDRLLRLMSARTGTPLERVRATTLLGLRGCGLDWRGGHEDAIRFCPACLEERPYFRRRWRLEFFTICDVHEFFLDDRCPRCRGLVRMEQVPPSAESVTICHNCGFDLRRAPAKAPAKAHAVSLLATRLLRVLDAGAPLQREEAAGTVVRAGVQVTARGRHPGVSERGLHQVKGSAAIEGMGSVRVPEPVRRYRKFDTAAPGGLPHDPQDGQRPELSAVFDFPGEKDRMAGFGIVPQAVDQFPYGAGYLNGACDAAFSEDRDLSALSVRLQIPPVERAQFAHAHPRGVEQREDGPVAGMGLQTEDAMQIGFGEDALGQPVAYGGQPQGAPHVERQITEAAPESEERFEGGKGSVAAGGREIAQSIAELLEVAQGDQAKRLPCPGSEPLRIRAVGPLGVTGAAVEPSFEELIVGGSLGNVGDGPRVVGKGKIGVHEADSITEEG